MGYYPNTIKALRDILHREYPGIEAKEEINDSPSKPTHLLWMLDRIEEMEDSPAKAGRWIGYCVRAVEDMGFLTNREARNLIRKDVQEGYE